MQKYVIQGKPLYLPITVFVILMAIKFGHVELLHVLIVILQMQVQECHTIYAKRFFAEVVV